MNRMQTEFIGRVFIGKKVPDIIIKIIDGNWDAYKRCWMYSYLVAGLNDDEGREGKVAGIQLRNGFDKLSIEATELFDLLYS